MTETALTSSRSNPYFRTLVRLCLCIEPFRFNVARRGCLSKLTKATTSPITTRKASNLHAAKVKAPRFPGGVVRIRNAVMAEQVNEGNNVPHYLFTGLTSSASGAINP